MLQSGSKLPDGSKEEENQLRIVYSKLKHCVNAFLELPFVYQRKDGKHKRSSSLKENPGKFDDISLYKIRHRGVKKLPRQTPELPCFLPNGTSLKILKETSLLLSSLCKLKQYSCVLIYEHRSPE
jgi:hypothetical protein